MNKIVYPLIISVFFLNNCAEPDYPTPKPSVSVLTGRIIAFNTAPSQDALDVTLDNNTLAPFTNDLAYGAIQPYKNIQAGPNRLFEYLNTANDSTFVTDRFSIVSGLAYSSFLYQNVAKTSGKFTYGVRRFTDDVAIPDPGKAKIRFLHFAYATPGITPTNLSVFDPGSSTTVFASRAYASVGTTTIAFTTMDATAVGVPKNWEIRDVGNNVLLNITGLNLASKGIYTIVVYGNTGNTPKALTYKVITH